MMAGPVAPRRPELASKSAARIRLSGEKLLCSVGLDGRSQSGQRVDIGGSPQGRALLGCPTPALFPPRRHARHQPVLYFPQGPVVALAVLDPLEIGNRHASGVGPDRGKDEQPVSALDVLRLVRPRSFGKTKAKW